MRLLSTKDYTFHEFYRDVPSYAILSHTWGEEEVSYHEWVFLLEHQFTVKYETPTEEHIFAHKVARLRSIKQKAGYKKIIKCTQIANEHGYLYIWADTCCIDKSSSAELSEAINSMFLWYKQSTVCYAYLSDVVMPQVTKSLLDKGSVISYLHPKLKDDFAKSRWFSRGWTLQELIAPPDVLFYGKDWVHLGSKNYIPSNTTAPNLKEELSSITGILSTFLCFDNLHHASVAQKMSWASRRETTRVEDMAYCLLGLFGVNMPLLYGEGKRAFLRLQEEIIRTSDDHSIFAWDERAPSKMGLPPNEWPGRHSGLLASSPVYFDNAGTIVPIPEPSGRPYSMTNTGLQIELDVFNMKIGSGWGKRDVAILNCHYENDYRGPLAITIKFYAGSSHASNGAAIFLAARRNLGISPLVLDSKRFSSDSPKRKVLLTVPQSLPDPGQKVGQSPPSLFFETFNGPMSGWQEKDQSGVQQITILHAWPERHFKEIGEFFASSLVREASVLVALRFGDRQPVCYLIVSAIRCPQHPTEHLRTTIDIVSAVTGGHRSTPSCFGSRNFDLTMYEDLMAWSYISLERRLGAELIVVKVGVWKPTTEDRKALMHNYSSSDAAITHPDSSGKNSGTGWDYRPGTMERFHWSQRRDLTRTTKSMSSAENEGRSLQANVCFASSIRS